MGCAVGMVIGSWGGRSGSSRGRAAYFGHDDRAGIREPSPPLEG